MHSISIRKKKDSRFSVGKNTSLKVDGKQEEIRLVDKTFVSQLLLGLVASEVF
jgi:hypothetical protein